MKSLSAGVRVGILFLLLAIATYVIWKNLGQNPAGKDVQTLFAYTWTWFLLVGGFRHVLEFRRIRPRGGKDSDSDAAVLRKMTFLPAPLWVGFFWIATFAALLYGGGILLGMLKLGR